MKPVLAELFQFMLISCLTTGVVHASEAGEGGALCKTLRTAGLVEHDKKFILPAAEVSDSETLRILRTRVCVKSYAANFPGEAEGLAVADSVALKGYRDGFKSKPGHDPEQACLFGSELYVRKLYSEGKYELALEEIANIRREHKLAAARLRTWDEMEEATYLSQQPLRNMIMITEYKVRTKLAKTLEAKLKVVEDFAKDRDALIQIFHYIGDDPTDDIRGAYCKARR